MGFLSRFFGSTPTSPQIRVYHSYGDDDRCFVIGHVLEDAPERETSTCPEEGGWLSNARAMLRLFSVKPQPGALVEVCFGGVTFTTTTNAEGFFHVDLLGDTPHRAGWHNVSAKGLSGAAAGVEGDGKVFHPVSKKQGFISDIDDTFLVSHSRNIFRRLRALLTKTPQTRKPFEGVVAHYQALALNNTTEDNPHPFFYVSSSEWNLYDYIRDFCRYHGLPEGIFLLSSLKQLSSFVKSGSNNHQTKYDRIARIMEEYPATHFVLLGDDTQHDPEIYRKIVAQFGTQVNAVYLRRRTKSKVAATKVLLDEIRAAGVPVCYFRHSNEALEHSRKIGLA